MISISFLHSLRQVKGGILYAVVQLNDSNLKFTINMPHKFSRIAMICVEIPEKVPKAHHPV